MRKEKHAARPAHVLRPGQDPVGSARPILSRAIPALLFVYFLTIALLYTAPLLFSAHRAVPDPVDALLNTWILAWDQHALLTRPLQLLHANIFYPYSDTLLYSETLLLPALLLLPVKAATGNALFVHNLFVWMGFVATGVGGYLLGRWLLRSRWSGLLVGTVFACNSYTLSNVAQAQLLHLEWMPLALLYLGLLLRRPRLRYALFLALFLAAQFYTTVYYAIFIFLAVVVAGSGGWLLRSFPSHRIRWQTSGLLVGGIVLGGLLCFPLAFAYANLSQELGLVRVWSDTWPFSASLEMWRTAPPENLLYGGRIGQELPRLGFYALDALFPGFLLLAMALSGLVLWMVRSSRRPSSVADRSSGRTVLGYPLLLVVAIGLFFLLSLGPYPQLRSLQPNFDVILPYAWIHQWIPGFKALRAPVRFATFVFLGLGIAAGYLLAHLHRWTWLRGWTLPVLLLFLLLVENAPAPTTALYTPTIDPDRRAVYTWLATQEETVYLEWPVTSYTRNDDPDRWLESQYGSTFHWQSTPVGHSGFWPPRYDELVALIARFPQPQSVHFLQALGVEWLILSPEQLPLSRWQAIARTVSAHGWETHRWNSVQAIRLPPMAVHQPQRTYFIPEQAQQDAHLAVTAIFTATAPTPVRPHSDLGRLRAEWWQAERRLLTTSLTHQPPFFADPVAIASLSIPTPAGVGQYELRLFDAHHTQLLAKGPVNVATDVAPPEITLLPVIGEQAVLRCEPADAERQTSIGLHLRTIGWYDEPFTLSVRLLDDDEAEVARSADVAFPPQPARSELLATQVYTLPLSLPDSRQAATAEVLAYQWQQEAERIVPRYFVNAGGAVIPSQRLPIVRSAPCP